MRAALRVEQGDQGGWRRAAEGGRRPPRGLVVRSGAALGRRAEQQPHRAEAQSAPCRIPGTLALAEGTTQAGVEGLLGGLCSLDTLRTRSMVTLLLWLDRTDKLMLTSCSDA